MIKASVNFYVLTGGPGTGKTSLLNSLDESGFITVPEDARRIIQQQMAANENGLPWKDKKRYAELMFNASIDAYKKYSSKNRNETVFFDRGILDAICYMQMEGIPLPAAAPDLIKKYVYSRVVFILPPWKEIYVKDTERRQTWKEAVFIFEKMQQTYSEYGYHILEVPRVSVAERVGFIHNFIKSHEL